MLRWRLLLGSLFIAGTAALFWRDSTSSTPGAWLFPLAVILCVASSNEVLWLFSARDLQPLAWIVYGGNLLILAANWVPHLDATSQLAPALGTFGWPAAALAVSMIMTFVGEMRRYTGPGRVTEQLSTALFGLLYVGWLLSFLVQMRFLGPPGQPGAWGIPALASLVIVVKMGDTGAYTVGRLVGRHKMAPILSPGKTWEGAIGGLAFACLGSWVALRVFFPDLSHGSSAFAPPALGWLFYGLLVGLAGMWGDLAESLLKRDTGRKDSSPWMPGFGGVLDILDSILLGAPVAYLAWAFGLVAA